MTNRVVDVLHNLHILWARAPREQKRQVWNRDWRNRDLLEALEIYGPQRPRTIAKAAHIKTVPQLHKLAQGLLEEMQ